MRATAPACTVLLLCALAGAAAAQVGDGGKTEARRQERLLREWGRGVPFAAGVELAALFLLHEKAGLAVPGAPGREAPSYDEAFGTGIGAGARFSYTFRPVLSAFISAGYEGYPGRSREEGPLGAVRYGDMSVVPCLAGLRFGAPIGLAPGDWLRQSFSPRVDGAYPFVEAAVGIAWRSGVEMEPVGRYWEPAAVFSGRAACGIELRYEGLVLAAAAVFVYHSEPPESRWYAEAEATMALAASASVSMRF